jgi:hypothetical protein
MRYVGRYNDENIAEYHLLMVEEKYKKRRNITYVFFPSANGGRGRLCKEYERETKYWYERVESEDEPDAEFKLKCK